MGKVLSKTKSFKVLEVDFSKFDKSQEHLILTITCLIMKRLNMPENLIQEWYRCHIENVLIFHKIGISIKTQYQRRSGDIFTFIGNTLCAMIALCYCYDVDTFIGGVFGGDDSTMFMLTETIISDKSQEMADIFNLSARIELYSKSIYFSSHFFINTNGKWYMVPDPIKAFTRLGRHDIFCYEHLICYHTSFQDNLKDYKNSNVRYHLNIAAMDRYANKFIAAPTNLNTLIMFLTNLVYNRSDFIELFVGDHKIMNRRLPITIKESLTKSSTLYLQADDIWAY